MKITHFFKYNYNISILFIMIIIINTTNYLVFEGDDLIGCIILNVTILIFILSSIKNKRDRKITLANYNAYEKIDKLTLLTLIICILTTVASLILSCNLFNLDLFVTKYNQNIIEIPVFMMMILLFATNIKKGPSFLLFMMNPINVLNQINDQDTINDKIKKELRRLLKLFDDKTINFEYVTPKNMIDILSFVDVTNCIFFNVKSEKNKTTYKIDHDFFYYGDKQFKKLDLYSYLRSAKLKIDTMTREDWEVAEMYFIH